MGRKRSRAVVLRWGAACSVAMLIAAGLACCAPPIIPIGHCDSGGYWGCVVDSAADGPDVDAAALQDADAVADGASDVRDAVADAPPD